MTIQELKDWHQKQYDTVSKRCFGLKDQKIYISVMKTADFHRQAAELLASLEEKK